jgi:hypothetical protein
MVIYGSYIAKSENLVTLGAQVTLIDVSIAFLAGLLIIPAMYVAQAQGVPIFAEDGSLISGPNLVFDVLPTLFNSMGAIGLFVTFGFFVLMSIAALTSSISMLEGPVSYVVECHEVERKKATTFIGLTILVLSAVIIVNFDLLFGLVISISTVYGQPLIAMLCCIFVGYALSRDWRVRQLPYFFWALLFSPAARTLAVVRTPPPQSGCSVRPPDSSAIGLPEFTFGPPPQRGCLHEASSHQYLRLLLLPWKVAQSCGLRLSRQLPARQRRAIHHLVGTGKHLPVECRVPSI